MNNQNEPQCELKCEAKCESEFQNQKRYTAILLLLSSVHKNGNQTVKDYAIQLAKLLGNIINISNNIILNELQDGLEYALISYMADIKYLLSGGSISEQDCDHLSRSDLLQDINGMVRNQMKYGDKIEQAKNILFSVN